MRRSAQFQIELRAGSVLKNKKLWMAPIEKMAITAGALSLKLLGGSAAEL
jgi:hypothetical protein